MRFDLIAWVVGIAVAWWLLGAVFIPERACCPSHGSGSNQVSGNGRRGRCWFCRGDPWRMTFGAWLVRRLFRRKNQ